MPTLQARLPDAEGLLRCARCGGRFPATTAYWHVRRSRDIFDYWCRTCKRDYNAAYRQTVKNDPYAHQYLLRHRRLYYNKNKPDPIKVRARWLRRRDAFRKERIALLWEVASRVSGLPITEIQSPPERIDARPSVRLAAYLCVVSMLYRWVHLRPTEQIEMLGVSPERLATLKREAWLRVQRRHDPYRTMRLSCEEEVRLALGRLELPQSALEALQTRQK